ncbi:hypothetical protein ACB098_06G020800 [Castanea mollissima]
MELVDSSNHGVCNKFKVAHSEGSNERFNNSKSLCYKPAQICCLGVSVFSLVLCLLSYFYWYRNGWPYEGLVTLLDLALRTLAWGTLCVYLRNQLFNSVESKYPFLSRIWWGFYLCISFSLPVQNLVFDIVSVVLGLFFCYVGFFGKNEGEDTLLEEPLLNGDSSNEAESNKSKGDENVTPYLNAGFFSILTFSWMGPLITIGNKKTLDLEDVPQLGPSDSVFGAFPNFKNKLEAECGTSNGVTTLKLTKALIFLVWKEVLLTAFLAIMNTLSSYVGPYFIDTSVQYLNGRRSYKNEGYVLVSVFFAAKLVECLAQRHWTFRLQQVGIRVRSVLILMIYNKGLTLSCQSKQGHTSGEIINFMTVDADRIGDFSWYMHETWMVLVQIVIALLILYKNVGLASIAALVATVFVMLANVPLGKLQKKFQGKIMESKDKRMKATSEILRNMMILKLQGWEMKFLAKIMEIRKTEAGWLIKYVYTSAMTELFCLLGCPSFVSEVTFGTCMLKGIPLESGKILSAFATFRILQEPIYSLPETISMVTQTKVSLDRIVSFLCLDDLQSDVIERLPRGSSDIAIEIIDGKFCWDLSSSSATLEDINLKVQQGMRVAVCGTVGSGKSSLLSCILGEVPKISGTVKLCGTKAYVVQSPWIQSGKIEENILFGREMEREKYEKVLEACSLRKDLEILPFGDQTVIGVRGINLSGGQKQRIQIARALYQDADIYLFDDPFSAVDAHMIPPEYLLGLLDSKTVVYVTHQVEFLPAADLILVMKDGRITQAGKYNDILNSGTDFMELVGAHKKALSVLDSTEAWSVSGSSSKEAGNLDSTNCKEDDVVSSKGQIIQEEEREKGGVGISVYWKFITMAYGGTLLPIMLLAQVLSQTLQIGSDYWMAWATPVSEDVKPSVDSSTLMIVYVALAIGSSFCVLVRSMLIRTQDALCIFRAPMSFFDATPSGRILSRASTDQSAVDFSILNEMGAIAFSIIRLLGIIAVMSQTAWQVFIIFIPVIAACIWYQQYYIPSARELSRLVGVCKAPVIQHFTETISGATTIRSFDEESRFRDTNMKLADANSRPRCNIAGAMEWLCFRLDMLSSVTIAFSLLFLISIPEGVIDPGITGLSLTYGLTLNILQIRPTLVIEESQPDRSWPSHGEVDFRDLQVRYAPHMPLALRGLTCTFPGEMKTGIVGRTGSGKSTLIQTLFRIVEPTAGQIMIDGINISVLGLHDLRSRLSTIPQDPTMFEGIVRTNLDPLEEYTDEQIWEALEKCQLGDEVRKKEGKLDSIVSENGENWSVGQRQLVCLGRVLLRKARYWCLMKLLHRLIQLQIT